MPPNKTGNGGEDYRQLSTVALSLVFNTTASTSISISVLPRRMTSAPLSFWPQLASRVVVDNVVRLPTQLFQHKYPTPLTRA